jgi:hypothetical protein
LGHEKRRGDGDHGDTEGTEMAGGLRGEEWGGRGRVMEGSREDAKGKEHEGRKKCDDESDDRPHLVVVCPKPLCDLGGSFSLETPDGIGRSIGVRTAVDLEFNLGVGELREIVLV